MTSHSLSHSKKYHYFDNTRVSCAKNCLRQYYLRHIRDWVRDGKSIALSFGSSWHAAMDTAWGLFWTDHSDKEILTAAISAFNKHWVEEENLPAWETITPEQEDQFAPRTPGIAAEMLHSYISLRRPMLKSTTLSSQSSARLLFLSSQTLPLSSTLESLTR